MQIKKRPPASLRYQRPTPPSLLYPNSRAVYSCTTLLVGKFSPNSIKKRHKKCVVRKSILLTHLKCLCFFYLNIITILFPRICPMSDETRQNRSKRDKMRQDIKMLIIATILQPDNLKIQYLCPFPAIIHYSSSIVPGGLLVKSYITRLTPFTSLIIRFMVFCKTANGMSVQSAVIKSDVLTARRTTA